MTSPEENADLGKYPNISGIWLSKSDVNTKNVSKYTFIQEGKHLSGHYIDERDGKLLFESIITGYIDSKGNVIFDIYIGKVTATNRLILSSDEKTLGGRFTTTVGNSGEIQLIKSE